MTVKTRATIASEIATFINDNSVGDVTPADVRTRLVDLLDSLATLQEDLGLGSTVAAAATLSLGTGQVFVISGNTGITDIDFSTPWDGRLAILLFSGTPQITHNATTLKLPGGANLTMAAGDRLILVQESGDNINVIAHIKASGAVLTSALSGTIADANLPTRLQTTSETVTDANSATSSGFYDMASGGSNVPETSAYSILVVALDSNNLVQVGVAHASQRNWIRRRVSGTFGAWTALSGQAVAREFAGTTDTLVLADSGGTVRSTGASAAVCTVPPNSSVAFAIDTVINLVQWGAGNLSIAAGAGVTIRSEDSYLKLNKIYSAAAIQKRGTDEWHLSGSLKA